jgi:DNA-binding Lrp family transcriptional regulator
MLVAMATGTGKTFTMVNQVYRLMKAGVAQRILFLVDRRVLAAQAVLAFASFDPEPGLKFDKIYEVYSQRFQRGDFDEDEKFDPRVLPSSYLTDPQPGHAFVYVSTIQRMTINLFGRDAIMAAGDEELDEDASQLNIPIHAFDLIIADECHRGYLNAVSLSTVCNTSLSCPWICPPQLSATACFRASPLRRTPAARTWSTTWPGHRPLVLPVDGHGCCRSKECLAATDLLIRPCLSLLTADDVSRLVR